MNQKIPILSVVTALLLSSCNPVRIAQINADPLRYRNRTVQVQGVVTESAGAFSFGGYQVSDGTGKIYVLSTRGVPATGPPGRRSGRYRGTRPRPGAIRGYLFVAAHSAPLPGHESLSGHPG